MQKLLCAILGFTILFVSVFYFGKVLEKSKNFTIGLKVPLCILLAFGITVCAKISFELIQQSLH